MMLLSLWRMYRGRGVFYAIETLLFFLSVVCEGVVELCLLCLLLCFYALWFSVAAAMVRGRGRLESQRRVEREINKQRQRSR